jgi:hypothetical protein
MRVIAPAFAFWTAGEAAFEFARQQCRRKYHESLNTSAEVRETGFNWSVRDVMYVVEVPSLTMCGFMLACGQFGFMALPIAWHKATLTMFSGASTFTTILLALFI